MANVHCKFLSEKYKIVLLIVGNRVEVREVGGRKVTVFNQVLDEDTAVATIVVRSSTENVLNDVERALDDGIHAVKTIFSDPRLLAGAGATEL